MVAGNFFLLPAVVSIGCSQRRCTQEAQQGEGKAQNRAEHSDGALDPTLPRTVPKTETRMWKWPCKKETAGSGKVSPLVGFTVSPGRRGAVLLTAHLIGWPPGDYQQHACWN